MEPDVIIGVLTGLPLPMGVALVILLAAWWRAGRRNASRAGPLWASGVALAAGVVLGYWRESLGMWAFPPRELMQWVPVVAAISVLAGVFASAAAVRGGHPVFAWCVRGVFSLAVISLISMKKVRGGWSGFESVAWIGGMGAATALAWGALDRLAAVWPRLGDGAEGGGGGMTVRAIVPAWTGPLCLIAWCGLSSLALTATSSISLGQVAGLLSACGGSAVLVAIARPRLSVMGGGSVSAALVMGTVLFAGHHASSLDALWMVVLLAIAPVLAGVIDVALLRNLTGWKRVAGRLAAISVLPVIVLAVAIPEAIRAAENQY